ncbi:hypothetical protein PFICI_10744 [Pestalotiopsis fici W106-1]|uniref:Uncharacterized protein n=1 Tax=Pestalotiopsis fici (strain W106-1 / CGMCC3.15140) TaxID=1229662 RepID=W3WSN3_PESFW|nr:uncharacterized protein PFICI_10744 [Pestalotiopsis fici W106-1]ETS76870.1 hypothetical protein PFICI_10744 [Pestalotiopsis fici W106-1]
MEYTSGRKSALAALGLVLLPASMALPGWPRSGTIIQGDAIQFDQSTWEENLERPNATGSFPITGFDISKAFTSPPQTVDGWELAVNVTSSISDADTLNPGNATGQVYTGTSIYLRAPDDVIAALDPDTAADNTTWKICVTVMTGGPGEDDTSSADNGTCSSLSSQCISDFQDAYADQFAKLQDCYRQPSIPDSCGDSLSQANLTTQQYALDHLNGTEVFVTASGPHDGDDNTAYDNAVKTVWPVLVVWGWNTRADVSDGTKPTVQLTCARANHTGDGSDSSASMASRSHGPVTITFAIAVLAAVILF